QAEARALASLPSPEAWKERRRILAPDHRWGHPEARLPPCLTSVAAAAPASKEPLPGAVLVWLAPDGQLRAELVLPEWTTPQLDEELWLLAFVRVSDGAMATERVGTPVRLAGVESEIDQEGRAGFSLSDLRGTDDLVLHVGADLELWHPVG